MSELDDYLATNPKNIPTFTSSFRYGVLKMFCSDSFSAEWMKNVIKNMTPPWDGANITCEPVHAYSMPNRQSNQHQRLVPRRPTIRFFIPDGVKKPTFDEVAKKLEQQNHPLTTNRWVAWKAEEKEDGIFYHVSVEEADIEFINTKNGRLFYCFTKIKINMPRVPRGDGANVANHMGNEQN